VNGKKISKQIEQKFQTPMKPDLHHFEKTGIKENLKGNKEKM